MTIFAQHLLRRTMSTASVPAQVPSRFTRVQKLFLAATATGFCMGAADGASRVIRFHKNDEKKTSFDVMTLATFEACSQGMIGALLGALFPVTLIAGTVYMAHIRASNEAFFSHQSRNKG